MLAQRIRAGGEMKKRREKNQNSEKNFGLAEKQTNEPLSSSPLCAIGRTDAEPPLTSDDDINHHSLDAGAASLRMHHKRSEETEEVIGLYM